MSSFTYRLSSLQFRQNVELNLQSHEPKVLSQRSDHFTVFSAYIACASSPKLDPDVADNSMGQKFPHLEIFNDFSRVKAFSHQSFDYIPAKPVAKCNQFMYYWGEGTTDVASALFKQISLVKRFLCYRALGTYLGPQNKRGKYI